MKSDNRVLERNGIVVPQARSWCAVLNRRELTRGARLQRVDDHGVNGTDAKRGKGPPTPSASIGVYD
jgi:hypothetical protein